MEQRSGTVGSSPTGLSAANPGNGPNSQPNIKETAGQVQEAVAPMIDQAKQQGLNQLSGQKDRAAETLGGVAGALRQTGANLRGGDQDAIADLVERAAVELERFSTQIRTRDVEELVDEVETFARRQPALFLGGAFVLGLLATRFLKSTRPTYSSNGVRGTNEYGSYDQPAALPSASSSLINGRAVAASGKSTWTSPAPTRTSTLESSGATPNPSAAGEA